MKLACADFKLMLSTLAVKNHLGDLVAKLLKGVRRQVPLTVCSRIGKAYLY